MSHQDNIILSTPGHGTYTQHGYIYSSLVGELRLVTNTDKTVTVEVDGLKEDSLVPGQQDVVTVKIVSVNPRWVECFSDSLQNCQMIVDY